MSRRLVVCVLLSSCASDPAPVAVTEAVQPHAKPAPIPGPARFDHPAMARYHMQQHFDDLRGLERLLIKGKLQDATTLGYLLVRTRDTPIARTWDEDQQRVSTAALAFTKATTLDEAVHLEVQVAAACADCHVHTGTFTGFGTLTAVPRDTATIDSRMARHVWATDRLWEGLVGADDVRWTQGLEVLADTELPIPRLAAEHAKELGLQTLARDQLRLPPGTPTATRAAAYGEMLATCVGCHASLAPHAP